jgi:hypothetical protein
MKTPMGIRRGIKRLGDGRKDRPGRCGTVTGGRTALAAGTKEVSTDPSPVRPLHEKIAPVAWSPVIMFGEQVCVCGSQQPTSSMASPQAATTATEWQPAPPKRRLGLLETRTPNPACFAGDTFGSLRPVGG